MGTVTGYRMALVEYLNTFPFSIGLRLSGADHQLEIEHVTPSECARLFKEGKVDISLCPVGALDELPDYEISGMYCIGADGVVGTVVLLSNIPLEKITSVRLDSHSRTSNQLVQILAEHHWKQSWSFYFDDEKNLPETCLMIGDKVFEQKAHYKYKYDLAEAWKEMTGLPIVFAVWITRPGIPKEVMDTIDHAFETGMEYIGSKESILEDWQKEYLLNFISYPLDHDKLKALRLYRSLSQ
ncbi:MAG: menaquinone biosynthesis protein [Bacteroidota bacterium]|nr:menaquinone biosynthesis protein [Bacteroidota bacterium]